MLTLIIANFAFAAPVVDEPSAPHTRVALRMVMESWSDGAIGTVYGTGGIASGIGAVVPVWGPLSLDIEATYKRVQYDDQGVGDDGQVDDQTDYATNPMLELVPLSLLVEYRLPGATDSFQSFVSLGPTYTSFSERHAPDEESGLGVTAGARVAAELRAGMRFDTGLIQPKLAPAASPVDALELEFYLGRRAQRGSVEGFNLSAWRAAVGLSFRL